MLAAQTVKRKVYQQMENLPPEGFEELASFLDFLAFKHRLSETSSAHAHENEQSAPYGQTGAAAVPSLHERVAQDYDALAAMYDELADELADEVWMPAENAALLQTEKEPA